jgi:hypothetical protein
MLTLLSPLISPILGPVEPLTVTVADAAILPPEPVQLMEYVVVPAGLTDWDPEVPEIVNPLGAVAEQEDAFVLDQVRVELPPEVMEVGLATNEAVGAGVLPP